MMTTKEATSSFMTVPSRPNNFLPSPHLNVGSLVAAIMRALATVVSVLALALVVLAQDPSWGMYAGAKHLLRVAIVVLI